MHVFGGSDILSSGGDGDGGDGSDGSDGSDGGDVVDTDSLAAFGTRVIGCSPTTISLKLGNMTMPKASAARFEGEGEGEGESEGEGEDELEAAELNLLQRLADRTAVLVGHCPTAHRSSSTQPWPFYRAVQQVDWSRYVGHYTLGLTPCMPTILPTLTTTTHTNHRPPSHSQVR